MPAQGASVLVNGYDEAETIAALKALREQYPQADGERPRIAAPSPAT
ncbi:hypothetical protein [Streptomyces sp. MA5143a]|nr:hypothetical protein [Streptomyces sp. MA5143a]